MKQIRKVFLFVVGVILLAANAHAGRWLSHDPMEVQEHLERDPHPFFDLNPYTFVRNNPLRYVDPWGLNAYVINAGGYFGHTSFVVDDPTGGVVAYHFFAGHHGDGQPWYLSYLGAVYDSVHIWPQNSTDVNTYLAGEAKLYGDVSVWAVGVGTSEDDAKAIARMSQEIADQEGYYSFLGGRECHKQSWDWYHDYVWGGRDVPISQFQGNLTPPFINGKYVMPPSFFTLTPAFTLPQLPTFGPIGGK